MTEYENALDMAERFRTAEEKVARERGGFYLFGLFEREDSPGRWDVVASAPWLTTDYDGTLSLVVSLRDNVESGDWKKIGGVFPIEPSSPYVEWITKNYRLQHHVEEVRQTGFGSALIDMLSSSRPTHHLAPRDSSPSPLRNE